MTKKKEYFFDLKTRNLGHLILTRHNKDDIIDLESDMEKVSVNNTFYSEIKKQIGNIKVKFLLDPSGRLFDDIKMARDLLRQAGVTPTELIEPTEEEIAAYEEKERAEAKRERKKFQSIRVPIRLWFRTNLQGEDS